jgi:lipopolysaccharide transport system permease protein
MADLASHAFPSSSGSGSLTWAHRRDLLRVLIGRDLKLRYRGSLFGMAWTLLNPLAELLVLVFIFDTVLPLDIPHYPAFLFTGLLVYNWFQSSLHFATVTVVGNRDLIRRPDVPLAILPVVTVAGTLVHFLLSLPVLFALLVASDIRVTSAAMLLPALIAVQFVVILALSYPLAAIHVWFRDTQYLLRVALQLLFYLTPVFYEASTVPARFAALYNLNPMVTIVDGYRDVLLRGVAPPLGPWVAVATVAIVVLALAVASFRALSPRFVDEL